MSALAIRFDDCLEWGCPGSDTDRANYEQAVAGAIEEAYPSASVTVQLVPIHAPRVVVTTRDAEGRIQIDNVTARTEEEISEHVLEIARAVWDAGEFWAEEAS